MGCICPPARPSTRTARRRATACSKGCACQGRRRHVHALLHGPAADRLGRCPSKPTWRTPSRCSDRCAPRRMDLGVKIALENHSGDMQAREVKIIIEESGKDFVASCLDTGNPMWVVEDPFVTLETLAPVRRHHARPRFRRLRTSARRRRPVGRPGRWQRRFRALRGEFRKLCPQSSMQLEIITGRPPRVLPYLEPISGRPSPRCRPGVRPLRGAGQERPSVHGRHGDRRRRDGKQPAVIDEALKRAAARSTWNAASSTPAKR